MCIFLFTANCESFKGYSFCSLVIYSFRKYLFIINKQIILIATEFHNKYTYYNLYINNSLSSNELN